MFHQVEGLVVDKDINFAHLKMKFWSLSIFLKTIQGKVSTFILPIHRTFSRSRYNGKEWLAEIMGCGMVHPNVLKNVGLNPEVYSGFALVWE